MFGRLLVLCIIALSLSLLAAAQPDPNTEVQGAIKQLQTDKDQFMRCRAATQLGDLGAADAVPALCQAVAEDTSNFVAREAAKSLQRLGDKQAVPSLLKGLDRFAEEPNAGPAIMQALISFADPAMKTKMVSLLDTKYHNTVIILALTALETLHDASTAEDRIVALIKPDQTGRQGFSAARAALSAARFGLRQAVPSITGLLKNEHPFTRASAAQALGILHDPASMQPLQELLADNEPLVRAAVVEALGAYRKPELCARFAEATRDTDATVRVAAIPALASCGNAEAANALLTVLHDDNAGVRAAAAEALGKVGTLAQMIPLLSNPSPAVRAAAAQAMGAGGKADAALALLDLLGDTDRAVRAAAVTALARLQPAPVDAVSPLLKSPNAEMRARAAESLGRMQVNAEEVLMEVIADPEPAVRRWAIWALGEAPGAAPLDGILTTINDPDPAVRCEAYHVAAHCKLRRIAPLLVQKMRLGAPPERLAAHTALCTLAGKDLGADMTAWKRWADEVEKE